MSKSSGYLEKHDNSHYVQEILSFLTGPSATAASTNTSNATFATPYTSSASESVVHERNEGANKKGKSQVLIEEVLTNLTEAMVYLPSSSNMDTNRKLWDNYAKHWNPDEQWQGKCTATSIDITLMQPWSEIG